MPQNKKKPIGIWMDYKQAYLIFTDEQDFSGEFKIRKEIVRANHDNDVYKNERFEKNKNLAELKKYYKAILDEIVAFDEIYIFGPGKAQEELKNVLREHRYFKDKNLAIGSSTKLSRSQMVGRVQAQFRLLSDD